MAKEKEFLRELAQPSHPNKVDSAVPAIRSQD